MLSAWGRKASLLMFLFRKNVILNTYNKYLYVLKVTVRMNILCLSSI
jgi:hypothetical protein